VHHSSDGDVDVALKKLSSAAVAAPFVREAQTLVALKHTHIVSFLGMHTSEVGDTYIVTAYCNAGTFLDFVREKPHQADFVVRSLLQQTAAGMAYLEKKQICHGDLSARK
jgi:serine/threonine protein kinase